MSKICALSVGTTALLALSLAHGSEVPRREEISIGSCRCEIQFVGAWRRLDDSDGRVELTNMSGSERVRGTIVPRGRHLVQLGCDELRQPYDLWLRDTMAELDIPSKSISREIVLGVGADRLDATEIEWVQNGLQSTYWLFSKQGRAFVVHFFGWSDDSRRMSARKEVVTLLGRLKVLTGPSSNGR
jgi:hypothetical protein